VAAKKTVKQPIVSPQRQTSSAALAVPTHAEVAKDRRDFISGYMRNRQFLGGQVSSIEEARKVVPEIAAQLKKQNLVNPRTGKPYSAATITKDLSETIGQWTYVKPLWQSRILLHVDTTFKDYVFWDALRRGTAPGYEVSGPAFCLPTAQTIASYCFGKGINVSLVQSAIPTADRVALHEAAAILSFAEANGKPTQNIRNANKPAAPQKNGKAPQSGTSAPNAPLQMIPKAKPTANANDRVAWTNLQLRTFIERNQGLFVSTTVDEYCLGNQFLIVNPDCTLSIASPETVTVEYSAADFRRPVRYIITTKMEKATVQDIYTDTKRTVTVQYYDERGTETREYENLIGRIPIVHLANDRSANEIYGRPIFEGQLPLLRQYDDIYFNMVQGVKMLGNPIPAFTGLKNPTESKQLNSTAVPYIDADGNQQIEYEMRLDRNTGLWIGDGGDVKMLSTPVGFTKDSDDALRQTFLLLLNGVRIPEMVWGGAIASSKASADAQMPPFLQYINYRRLMLEGEGSDPTLNIDARGGILELIDIWLRTYKLLNPAIVVGPVQIEWPEIDVYGDQTKYLWATALAGMGKITDELFVKASNLTTDPAGEVRAAAGQKVRAPQFDQYDEQLRAARAKAMRIQDEALVDDPDDPYSTDYISVLTDIDLEPAVEHPSPDLKLSIAGPVVWSHELG
jgi:hypothetical protein